MKTKGFFWHVHHNELVEWSDNIQERIDYINKDKPKQEIALRLKLLQPVNGKLPDEYVKADEARVKAYEARDKADEAWEARVKADEAYEARDKAYEARDKAYEARVKAYEARDKAYEAWEAREKYKSQIEELHNKECPNCPWNGTTIFVKEAGIE